jgi:hypothetical protein
MYYAQIEMEKLETTRRYCSGFGLPLFICGKDTRFLEHSQALSVQISWKLPAVERTLVLKVSTASGIIEQKLSIQM